MAETPKGGRPISASMRPTGTDKAVITGRKQYLRRKRVVNRPVFFPRR